MENVAGELSAMIGPLRRSLLRTTKRAEGLPPLQDATVELLRVVDQAGAVTVADAARQLNAAPSTVSNLLRTLVRDGLIERRPDSTDRRVAYIELTPLAAELLHRYDEASRRVVAGALERMRQRDREHLAEALPALRSLLAVLQDEDSGRP